MLSMAPGTAVLIFLVLFVVGLAAGVLTDALFGHQVARWAAIGHDLDHHDEGTSECFPRGEILLQWRDCSLARGILGLGLGLFLLGLLSGDLGPPHWNWIRITLLLTSGVGLFIVATVPDDFLETHLWRHIARQHVPRILLWTFGALLVMHIMVDQLQLADWMQENRLLMLLAACLVGLIPESGPHLVFLTLYTQGAVPFSILLASSIVQDGHGMLPLLADSRTSFVVIKIINLAVGLLVGFLGYMLGW